MGTDVQVVGPGTLHGAPLAVGDEITGFSSPTIPSRESLGTIGLALHHPDYGPVVTTAGHVLMGATECEMVFPPGEEWTVAVQSRGSSSQVSAIAHKVCISGDSDYAILSAPAGQAISGLYHASQSLGPPYVPDEHDLDTEVYVLTVRGLRPTLLRGFNGRLSIEGLSLVDVLVADDCTSGGDSGACLVNQASRPMGFVEGITQLSGRLVSVFSSVVWVLNREKATAF